VRTGAVEIHTASRGCRTTITSLIPRYTSVELHVVLRDDGSVARRADGAVVPVVVVDRRLLDDLDLTGWTASAWTSFGGTVCAADLAESDPSALRTALFRLGDVRLAARGARLEARLTSLPPAEVLWGEVLDGLGFSANREPMRALARALPIALMEERLTLEPPTARLPLARGLLFGAAGFLPLSPTDAALAGLEPSSAALAEEAWRRAGSAWFGREIEPTAWTRARVRPANHPPPASPPGQPSSSMPFPEAVCSARCSIRFTTEATCWPSWPTLHPRQESVPTAPRTSLPVGSSPSRSRSASSPGTERSSTPHRAPGRDCRARGPTRLRGGRCAKCPEIAPLGGWEPAASRVCSTWTRPCVVPVGATNARSRTRLCDMAAQYCDAEESSPYGLNERDSTDSESKEANALGQNVRSPRHFPCCDKAKRGQIVMLLSLLDAVILHCLVDKHCQRSKPS
jgi:hypothetical protein